MKKVLCFLIMASLCAVQVFAAQVHTVQSGDTLWKIAVRYHVGLSELVAANPQFADPNWIYPGDSVTIPVRDVDIDAMEQRVMELVNAERTSRGIAPLEENWEVRRVAGYKAMDLRDGRYFSHTSPTYGSPFDMLRSFGISFRAAGENIAMGQKTPESVMQAWMRSEGHRANILNPTFTHIGVGYCTGGSSGSYWVQMFIR